MNAPRDLEQLRKHGTATVAEMREFVAKMRGRNPQEVLGMVAGSNLVRAVIQATVGTGILLAIFSVGPYFMSKVAPKETVATAPATTQANAAATPSTTTETAPTPTATNGTQQNTSVEQAMKKMGMEETKPADPTKNPLEKNLDSLLDKLE